MPCRTPIGKTRDRANPVLILQRVPEPKTAKNRMHFDLHGGDVEAEVARLARLGATRLSAGLVEEEGCSWVVMADPDGNEFCVCRAPGDDPC